MAAPRCIRRSAGRVCPIHEPVATPRWAAGASVPIGAPSPTVSTMATARSGACRQGNCSSAPALATTSPVRSARATSAGKVAHAAGIRGRRRVQRIHRRRGRGAAGGAGSASARSGGSSRWTGSPWPMTCRTTVARATPTTGSVSRSQGSAPDMAASDSLMIVVTTTTTAAPAVPPSTAPAQYGRSGRMPRS